MRKKRARKSWSLPIENVPGLVLHANAKGTTLPIENVKIDPERRVIYGFVHAKHDRIVAQLSQQSRDRVASASSLLPFPVDQ
jgi:hypothetical protein